MYVHVDVCIYAVYIREQITHVRNIHVHAHVFVCMCVWLIVVCSNCKCSTLAHTENCEGCCPVAIAQVQRYRQRTGSLPLNSNWNFDARRPA